MKVRSLDGDTYIYSDTRVLQGSMLAPYLLIKCQDYVLRTLVDLMKENGFTLAKVRSRRYPAGMITDADYANDIVVLVNTPAKAESLLHNLERAVGDLGLHVNADKTESMYFNQRGDISALNERSLKLVDKFTYLRSSVSSTENDINSRLEKAWTAIDRLSIISKLHLSDKIKRSFFQAVVVSVLSYECTIWTLTKRMEKKLDRNCTWIWYYLPNPSARAGYDTRSIFKRSLTGFEFRVFFLLD